jgi:hypothetical protein
MVVSDLWSAAMKRCCVIAFAVLTLVLACDDRVYDPGFDPDPDPDPGTPELTITTPIYIVANVDGQVIGFDARDPSEWATLALDVVTDSPWCRIRISADHAHLLFNSSVSGVLTLIDASTGAVLRTWLAATDEFFFADSDNVVYSISGNICNYRISTGADEGLVTAPGMGCDHFPVMSPDGTRFVFKNQPSGFIGADFMVTDYLPETGCPTVELLFTVAPDPTDPIGIHEDLQPIWLDEKTILIKTTPDTGSALWVSVWNEGLSRWDSPIVVFLETPGGSPATFRSLSISPNRQRLLFYGLETVYILDTTDLEFVSGCVFVVTPVYTHAYLQTHYAGFTPDSAYFVAGTAHWIGIYDAVTLDKMAFDSETIIQSEGGGVFQTLYAIDAVE